MMSPAECAPPPDLVTLVDAADRATGVAEKLTAHQGAGLRHRALSAFLLEADDRILLQRRARAKYHFAGLWSNSCCTHPRPDESVTAAGESRVLQELGLRCRLREVGVFTYRARDLSTGLVEHEVDHVLVGRAYGPPTPDPEEVDEIMVMGADELDAELQRSPERFTPWLAEALAILRATEPSDHAPATGGGS